MLRTHTAVALIAALGISPALGAAWTYEQLDVDGDKQVSAQEIEMSAEETLNRWDADKDGRLSASEFETHHPELGINFDNAMSNWDADGDGALDKEEFSSGIYDTYDADRNQMIDQEEVAAAGTPQADQTGPAENAVEAQDVVELSAWEYEPLYTDGVSVDRLIGRDVLDPTGEDIGQVENVLISPEGQAVALVAEIGGLWELGDTHVSIPWDSINITDDGAVVPVTEETVGDYSLFTEDYLMLEDAGDQIQRVEGDGWGEVVTGPRVWRATELIGNYARLREGEELAEYGMIDDLILRDGRIAAAVVSPDLAGTSYAYPYSRWGWSAGSPYYDLPYDAAETSELEPFDYDRMNGIEPAA